MNSKTTLFAIFHSDSRWKDTLDGCVLGTAEEGPACVVGAGEGRPPQPEQSWDEPGRPVGGQVRKGPAPSAEAPGGAGGCAAEQSPSCPPRTGPEKGPVSRLLGELLCRVQARPGDAVRLQGTGGTRSGRRVTVPIPAAPTPQASWGEGLHGHLYSLQGLQRRCSSWPVSHPGSVLIPDSPGGGLGKPGQAR